MTHPGEQRLAIKAIHSPDLPCHPSGWAPELLVDVYCLLELSIGPVGDDGADIFSLMLATPEALRERAGDGIVLSDRATMVVSEYRWRDILAKLEWIVADCAASSWSEATGKLQRYFTWEYDGMR